MVLFLTIGIARHCQYSTVSAPWPIACHAMSRTWPLKRRVSAPPVDEGRLGFHDPVVLVFVAAGQVVMAPFAT